MSTLLRGARAALPIAALAVFVVTMRECFRLARVSGHLDAYGTDELPVVSTLGREPPESAVFARGFSVLAALLVVVLIVRSRQLRAESVLARAWLTRAAADLSGGVAIAALVVMAWIPDGASPIHFIAGVATFLLLSIHELIHAQMCVRAWRTRGFGTLDLALTAWLFACPLGSMAGVALWIGKGSAHAQWAAVALQFAYFLALIPELARAPVAPAET